jgi:insecticidal toxin complex protein TccC
VSGLYDYGQRYYAPWLQRWINPDPVGTVDGLNLFRFVRNSPLRFIDPAGSAPYDVLDDQEMDVLQRLELKITARGLQEFDAGQRSAFKSGARLAEKLLKNVLHELPKETPKQGVAKMLNAFGELHAVHKNQAVETLTKAFTEQRAYIKSLTTDAQWKISLFVTDVTIGGRTSRVTQSAPMKTVSLKAEFLNLHPLEIARVLIHEASHAAGTTMDYFYLPVSFLASNAESETVKQWSAYFRSIFAEIGKTGPRHSTTTPRYLAAMSELARREVTPESATIEFQDPAVRLPILLRNADTYSSFVMGTKLPARLMAKRNARAAQSGSQDRARQIS